MSVISFLLSNWTVFVPAIAAGVFIAKTPALAAWIVSKLKTDEAYIASLVSAEVDRVRPAIAADLTALKVRVTVIENALSNTIASN